MIKKIKGLTALWLALIMVLTMVPAMSAAGACPDHEGWTDIATVQPDPAYDGCYVLTSGMYVLNADFTKQECFLVKEGQNVTICLNGHDVSVSGWEQWLTINNAEVTVCNCSETAANITNTVWMNADAEKTAKFRYTGKIYVRLSSDYFPVREEPTCAGICDYDCDEESGFKYINLDHGLVAENLGDCKVWNEDNGGPHWEMDWADILSGTFSVEVKGNETVTLPNHPRICEEYADMGFAWIFRGWGRAGSDELLPGGAQLTNEQLHELDGGDERCDGYVGLFARFDYGYKVDVTNGSGDNYYAEGESVTIKADAISGKRFKKWKVEAAPVYILRPSALDLEDEGLEGDSSSMPALEGFDETAATTTFVMPRDEYRFTFTAEYENAPVTPVTPSTPGYDWYIPAPEEVVPETEDCWKVNCNKLNVRKAPSLFSGVITKLNRGDCINKGELTEDGKWIRYEVEEGVYGYVSADYVIACDCLDHIDLPMEKVVVCRKLNVRSGAGTSFAKVGYLTRGETVKIVSCDCNGWVKIEYNGGYAWISAAYIG